MNATVIPKSGSAGSITRDAALPLPLTRRRAGLAFTALLATAASTPSWGQQPHDVETVTTAVKELYARLSARDIGVLRYVPPTGFSEITNGSEPHQLDAGAFEKLFASPLKIDLHAEDVRAISFGNMVLVTGVRVGSITPPGSRPTEARHAFSMLWTIFDGQWQLRHVHLSSVPAS